MLNFVGGKPKWISLLESSSKNHSKFPFFHHHGPVKNGCISNRIVPFQALRHFPLNHGRKRTNRRHFLLGTILKVQSELKGGTVSYRVESKKTHPVGDLLSSDEGRPQLLDIHIPEVWTVGNNPFWAPKGNWSEPTINVPGLISRGSNYRWSEEDHHSHRCMRLFGWLE